jgi:hypothetical protein
MGLDRTLRKDRIRYIDRGRERNQREAQVIHAGQHTSSAIESKGRAEAAGVAGFRAPRRVVRLDLRSRAPLRD